MSCDRNTSSGFENTHLTHQSGSDLAKKEFMRLSLNSEQRARPARVRCFVEEVIAPPSAEIDQKQEFPMEFRRYVY